MEQILSSESGYFYGSMGLKLRFLKGTQLCNKKYSSYNAYSLFGLRTRKEKNLRIKKETLERSDCALCACVRVRVRARVRTFMADILMKSSFLDRNLKSNSSLSDTYMSLSYFFLPIMNLFKSMYI